MVERKKSGDIEIPVKWIYTLLAIVVLAVLIFFIGKSGFGIGDNVSQSEAEQILLNFFETEIPSSQVEVIDSSKDGNFYRFIVSLDGEQVPLFVTLDGKFMTIDLIPLE